MMNRGFFLKGTKRYSLPYCTCTQNQFRLDWFFCSSYLYMLGIYLNRNCLNLIITRGIEVHVSMCNLIRQGGCRDSEGCQVHCLYRARVHSTCRRRNQAAMFIAITETDTLPQAKWGAQSTKPSPMCACFTAGYSMELCLCALTTVKTTLKPKLLNYACHLHFAACLSYLNLKFSPVS